MLKNFKIENTFLGVNDHYGCSTFYLYITDGCLHSAFGGIALDEYDEDTKKRVFTKKGGIVIQRILETVGVSSWEELKGKYVRVDVDGDGGLFSRTGTRIANIVDDSLSFDYEELSKK